MDKLEKQITFIKEAEKIKSVVREAWSSSGRHESTAEHSWRLALMAGILAPSFSVDFGKVLMMCLVHDLGEIYMGDISAVTLPDEEKKHSQEEHDIKKLLSLLPEEQGVWLLSLWQEYNEGLTPEARLVKALDKAETIMQHNQGSNPDDFDYKFNLGYGRKYFTEGELLRRLREILDKETQEKLKPPAK